MSAPVVIDLTLECPSPERRRRCAEDAEGAPELKRPKLDTEEEEGSEFFRWAQNTRKTLSKEEKAELREQTEEEVEAWVEQIKNGKSVRLWLRAKMAQEAAARMLKERPDYYNQMEGEDGWGIQAIKEMAEWDLAECLPPTEKVDLAVEQLEEYADEEWANPDADWLFDWLDHFDDPVTDEECTEALLERVLPAILALHNNIQEERALRIFEAAVREIASRRNVTRLGAMEALLALMHTPVAPRVLFGFDGMLDDELAHLGYRFVVEVLIESFLALARDQKSGDMSFVAERGPLVPGSRFLRALQSLRLPKPSDPFRLFEVFEEEWEERIPCRIFPDAESDAVALRNTFMDRARCALLGLPVEDAASGPITTSSMQFK